MVLSRRPLFILGILTAAALAGCGEQQAQGPAEQPATEVSVVTVKARPVPLATDLPGRTTAFRAAEVRPQVNGVILKRTFVEGSDVKAGQQLYQIDPAPYEAAFESAQATLASAEAAVTSARLLAERYKALAAVNAVSQQDYANAAATLGQDEAAVAAARAAVRAAQINLTYTRLLSPLSGRIGRSSVTEGALVTANQTAALASVTQLDPMYVDVTQPATRLLALKRAFADGQLKRVSANEAEVRLTLDDGTPYALPGRLEFSEVTVDEGTGTVTLRARFPNPQGMLLPGLFVHERLTEGVAENAILVPQQGVTHNQRGEAIAYVVGADNKIEMRTLTTDRTIGHDWLVTQGVQAGDRVVVAGLQRIRPGLAVKPVEVDLSKPASNDPTLVAPGSVAAS